MCTFLSRKDGQPEGIVCTGTNDVGRKRAEVLYRGFRELGGKLKSRTSWIIILGLLGMVIQLDACLKSVCVEGGGKEVSDTWIIAISSMQVNLCKKCRLHLNWSGNNIFAGRFPSVTSLEEGETTKLQWGPERMRGGR